MRDRQNNPKPPMNGQNLSAVALSLLATSFLMLAVACSHQSAPDEGTNPALKSPPVASKPLTKTLETKDTAPRPPTITPPRSDVLSTTKLQSAATAPHSKSAQPNATAPERATPQDIKREKEIQHVVELVLSDLRKRDVLTTHTLHLKSGKDVQCAVVDESDTSLTVRFGGLTTGIEKTRIERIESRTPEFVEAELRRLALAQATKIVDEGLIQYGREWITPAEKARRIEKRRVAARVAAEEEKKRIRIQREVETARVQAEASSDSQDLSKIKAGQREINIFPNRGVPYEIPVGESLRDQAEYLFQVLRENGYSHLEKQLRQRVPEGVKLMGRSQGDIEPLDDIVALAVTATNPEIKEAFDLMVKGGVRGKGSLSNTELQVLFWLAAQNDFGRDDTLVQAIAMANGFWVAIGEEEVRKAVYEDVHDLLIFLRETNDAQESAGCYQLEDYPLEALVCLAWTGNYSAMSGRTQHLPSYKNRRLPLWAYEWLTVSDYRKMKEETIRRGWISCDVNKVISSLEVFFYFCDDGETQNCRNWLYKGGNEETTISGRKVVNHDTSNADYLFNFFLQNGYVVGDCGDETTLVNAFAISRGIATTSITYKLSFEGNTYRHFYNIYFDPEHRKWRAYEGHVGPGGYSPIFQDRPNNPITIYIHRTPIFQADYLKDTNYTKEGYGGRTVYWNDGFTISTLRTLLTEGVPSETMKEWLFGK